MLINKKQQFHVPETRYNQITITAVLSQTVHLIQHKGDYQAEAKDTPSSKRNKNIIMKKMAPNIFTS